MNIKIIDLEVKENFIIFCRFNNGRSKIYDMKTIIKDEKNFKELEDENLFNKVKIDSGGYGISWNENIDLAVEELWDKGKEVYITPDILKVEVLEDYLLKLIFKTKEEKIYDMKPSPEKMIFRLSNLIEGDIIRMLEKCRIDKPYDNINK